MLNSLSSLSSLFLIGTCLFGIPTTATPIAAGFVQRCYYTNNIVDHGWTVNIANDDKYDTGGCGAGFLDNFRGRCGAITNWGCNYVDGTTNIVMTFATSDFCTGDDITAAIRAASYGNVDLFCSDILLN
jgi:hypothetical protein